MDKTKEKMHELERIAWAPYEQIENPTTSDWKKSYAALKELCVLDPEHGGYPNTLGYLCYYGRHTGGKRNYREARAWFERGAELQWIQSQYKLADMLADGKGGPPDPKKALAMYVDVYEYSRDQFEAGLVESNFADTAMRMGKVLHEGKLVAKNDMQALGFLLEAKYAIEERERFQYYGDDVVKQNIDRLLDQCEKPDEKYQHCGFYGLSLVCVPKYLLGDGETQMTIRMEMNQMGILRLEFRRNRADGKKPNRILWSVAPAMKCFMTDFVVIYGMNVRRIWSKNPGEKVVCDLYEYDAKTNSHLFILDGELQCSLQEGKYVLPMNEFWMTLIRDHPESAGTGVM